MSAALGRVFQGPFEDGDGGAIDTSSEGDGDSPLDIDGSEALTLRGKLTAELDQIVRVLVFVTVVCGLFVQAPAPDELLVAREQHRHRSIRHVVIAGYPNVNTYASAPGSRKVICSVRSRTASCSRTSW